mmetsp:Transcript_87758/g.204231  ORF Transcript_87758/g.204231 Transcript_87758/m.204231 type:complete len:232 (+) Transcript_87758:1315-2010(+)
MLGLNVLLISFQAVQLLQVLRLDLLLGHCQVVLYSNGVLEVLIQHGVCVTTIQLLLLQVCELAPELVLQLLQHLHHLTGLELILPLRRRNVLELRLVGTAGQKSALTLAAVRPPLQSGNGLGEGIDGLGVVLVHHQVRLPLICMDTRCHLRFVVQGRYLGLVLKDFSRQALGLRGVLQHFCGKQLQLPVGLLDAALFLRNHVSAELFKDCVLKLLLVLLLLASLYHALQQL